MVNRVYCQLDGGSQITFNSDKLLSELGLSPTGNASFIIDTTTGSQPTKADLFELKVESLYNSNTFYVVNKPWKGDCNNLPHKLSFEAYEHFIDVNLKLLNNCERIDLLIGSDNACLMTALEEREGPLRFDPHALLTPLGWCAYGGASLLVMSALLKVKRVYVLAADEIELLRSDIVSKDRKIGQLEEALREMFLSESKIKMSYSDKKGFS